MVPLMRIKFTIPYFIAFVFSAELATAHPGRQDASGGHIDNKTGIYHCHSNACFEKHGIKKTDEALEEAIKEERQFSYLYNRKEWKHWSDFDGDCMNTRHEMLYSASITAVGLSPDGCYVSKGQWLDPFSGNTYYKASDLDVDHVIPLKWAHGHGGDKWSPSEKEKFANDPLNLIVVDDGLNQSKGARGPDEWMPPQTNYHCEYLSRWVDVLNKYQDLYLTKSELSIFNKKLERC
ncbi:hypothetical protein TDB9533_03029 [Thalassocella blandensis]|nr:hypothetical protein TDB9533_03029 [Thalassocella blandensis]